MPIQCVFSFFVGVVAGFVLAVSLIIGVALIPIILGVILLMVAYAYYRYRKEQKKREEILKRIFEGDENGMYP